MLGRLLGAAPGELRFATAADGKPRLLAGRGIEFNLTHSAGLVLLAVARERPVGIDVERLRPSMDVLGVARLALPPAEAAALAALADPGERRAAFFRCWTRKEAYLKARAEALPGPASGDPGEAGRWRIRSLPLGAAYAGAVAHEGDLKLRCFDLGSADALA